LDEFWKLKSLLKEMLENSFHPLQVLFQWNPHLFHRLPYFKGLLDKVIKMNRNLLDFYGRQIQIHMEEVDFDGLMNESNPTDLVEAFLKEKAKRDANGEEGHGFT
jgi:hypothetical protein